MSHSFNGKASSVSELISSIKNGFFTLDGRHLVIEDNLNLSRLNLASLVGCPQVIGGYFSCTNNKLMTLVGGPTDVGSDYYCEYNQLVSLKGAPRHIKGEFWCGHNKLSSLKYGPITVYGSYACGYNLINSLDGCAKIIKNHLISVGNKYLTSLEGGPRSVGGSVFLDFCKNIKSLHNIHVHLPEARAIFLSEVTINGPILGLLRVKGLKSVELDNHKLKNIINKYLPEGNYLACAMELIESGYKEHAKL
jgi:hypothetical protein